MATTLKIKKKVIRGRHWCLTINNPKDDEIPENKKDIEYLIVGREVGKTGTPHLQCYVVFCTRKSLNQTKQLFPRAHLELMKGTPLQASMYCKKDGKFEEFGKLPSTAAESSRKMMREKWDAAYDLAKKGQLEKIEKWMLIPYYHAFKRIQQDNPLDVEDLQSVCGIWIHGKSGAGKSHAARAEYPSYYDKPLNKWWDGYRGQETAIIDDLDEERAPYMGHYLKRWADKYSFPAEHKGNTYQIRPKKIVVTSQNTIEELFQGNIGAAIARRFEVKYLRNRKFWKHTKYCNGNK